MGVSENIWARKSPYKKRRNFNTAVVVHFCRICLKVYFKNKPEFFIINLCKQKHPFLAWDIFVFLVNVKICSSYKFK
jgi:hypothetical protein